jgi:hypothetical protein
LIEPRNVRVSRHTKDFMTDFFQIIARAFFTVLLAAVGLIVAASLLTAVILLLAGWCLRAGWARLTGRPVRPFVMGIDPRAAFKEVYRRAGAGRARAAAKPEDAAPRAPGPRLHRTGVTDVEPRAPQQPS